MIPRRFKRRGNGWKPVIVDGIRFLSKGEADRYEALKQQHPGLVSDVSQEYALLVCTAPGITETFKLGGVGQNKHNAKRTTVDGITFASGDEARRYVYLLALEDAGEIIDLRPHPSFELFGVYLDADGEIHITKIGKFTPDFQYTVAVGPNRGEVITEDVKSPSTVTEAYQMRKKLLWACHRISVTEVFAR